MVLVYRCHCCFGSHSSHNNYSAKNNKGKDHLYRLDQEVDNMNIFFGVGKGIIDDLFVGKFLGKDGN
jgi:hypothetical protein